MQVLGCQALHGGDAFEMLADESGEVFLCLHHLDDHDHPPFGSSDNLGQGLILYLHVDDLDAAWDSARKLDVKIDREPHINPNSGRKEFACWDPDGFYLMISQNESLN